MIRKIFLALSTIWIFWMPVVTIRADDLDTSWINHAEIGINAYYTVGCTPKLDVSAKVPQTGIFIEDKTPEWWFLLALIALVVLLVLYRNVKKKEWEYRV